jgi:transposase
VTVEYAETTYVCPIRGKPAKVYDHRTRKLRHLDTRDYKTMLEVRVPRVECPEHHAQQLELEFAAKHSWYTALFETLVILWLRGKFEHGCFHLMM